MGVTKIAIGLPTNRGLKPKTLSSLLKMVAHTPVDEVIISNEMKALLLRRTGIILLHKQYDVGAHTSSLRMTI
jgi:hypothetical protein